MEILGYQGKKIYVHEWLNVESPVGVVQIIHGMAEHAARYDEFAKFLNSHGFLVVADDHRGHGKTDPDTLGYCDGDMFADTVRDEAIITEYYKEKYPTLKYFLLGHSYGSFLTQSYLGKHGDLIDGAILSGSSYKKDFEVYLGSFVTWLSCLFGGAKKPANMIRNLSFGAYEKMFEDREWLSNNQESNDAYRADPACGFTCSNRFYNDFFRGLRKLYTRKYKRGLRKDLPVLLAAGALDPVGNQGKGMEKLCMFYLKKAKMKSVKLTLFPNSRHEFLNETEERDVKWGTVLHFLTDHTTREE